MMYSVLNKTLVPVMLFSVFTYSLLTSFGSCDQLHSNCQIGVYSVFQIIQILTSQTLV